jgi:hypothetical protein
MFGKGEISGRLATGSRHLENPSGNLDRGPLVGENHISKTLGGKVIFEHWADCTGTEGQSFTLFEWIREAYSQTG